MPATDTRINVIIVSYQCRDALGPLLHGLDQIRESLPIAVHIVDNASRDGTGEMLEREYPWVHALIQDENLGFAAAVNLAAARCTGEYLLLLNPDIRIDRDVVEVLLDTMERYPEAAAVAPKLVYPDGRLQPSRGSFPNLFRTAAHILHMKKLMPGDETAIRWMGPLAGRLFRQYAPLNDMDPVDYTTGACVMVRRSVFNALNGLDEQFFLYYEEIDFGLRLRKAGYTWFFLSTPSVTHQVAASSERVPLIAFEARYSSMLIFYDKNRSRTECTALRVIFRGTVLCRWGLACLFPSIRLDPEHWAAEKAVYRRLLRR